MRRASASLIIVIALITASAGTALAAPGPIRLTPQQETSAVDSHAKGFFHYEITGNDLCYTLEVANMTGAPTAAHIHLGPRNVAGGVVVPLGTPPAATSEVSACITAAEGGAMTPAELAAIAEDPRAYYVNVHTALYPGGEIRGQLR